MIDNNPLLQSSFTVDPIKEALGYIKNLSLDLYIDLAKMGLHLSNPYHNLTHELLVVYHSVHAYRHSDPITSASRDGSDLRLLVLAALFHDHNHSGGKTSNAENIKRAVARIDNLINPSPTEKETIIRIVEKTEFTNGKFPQVPHTFIGQCLRDADLCMIHTNEGRQLLMELPREIDGGLSVYRRPKKEIKEWLTKNREFLESCEMFTEYGKLMKEFHLARACQDLEDLVYYAVSANYVAGYSNWLKHEQI